MFVFPPEVVTAMNFTCIAKNGPLPTDHIPKGQVSSSTDPASEAINSLLTECCSRILQAKYLLSVLDLLGKSCPAPHRSRNPRTSVGS